MITTVGEMPERLREHVLSYLDVAFLLDRRRYTEVKEEYEKLWVRFMDCLGVYYCKGKKLDTSDVEEAIEVQRSHLRLVERTYSPKHACFVLNQMRCYMYFIRSSVSESIRSGKRIEEGDGDGDSNSNDEARHLADLEAMFRMGYIAQLRTMNGHHRLAVGSEIAFLLKSLKKK